MCECVFSNFSHFKTNVQSNIITNISRMQKGWKCVIATKKIWKLCCQSETFRWLFSNRLWTLFWNKREKVPRNCNLVMLANLSHFFLPNCLMQIYCNKIVRKKYANSRLNTCKNGSPGLVKIICPNCNIFYRYFVSLSVRY